MRFFGLFSRSPKPRVQGSSPCAPAKTKSRLPATFLFSYGDSQVLACFCAGIFIYAGDCNRPRR